MILLIVDMTHRTLDGGPLVLGRKQTVVVAVAAELREGEGAGVGEAGGFEGVAAVAFGGVGCGCC